MTTRREPDGDPGAVPGVSDEAARTGRGRTRPTGRLDDDRCSVRALARGDSGVGTAAPARRWVLVEQPGPWGRDALLQSRFDPAVAPRLAHRARVEGVRLLMVRRPDGRPADSGHRWAYADSRPGRQGTWWSVRGSDADVADAPWDGTVGEAGDEPTYLVCSHGGHDACCALRGRPLARAMRAAGADVWECSHLGGDRFAANVVVLPYGLYYGQVPGEGEELLAAHAKGQVALPWLRGRAGLPPPVQAAQHHAREEFGLYGIEDLPPLGVTRLTPVGAAVERWVVALGGADGDVVVAIESRPSAEASRLTCAATHPAHTREWHVLSTSVSADGRTVTSRVRRQV